MFPSDCFTIFKIINKQNVPVILVKKFMKIKFSGQIFVKY